MVKYEFTKILSLTGPICLIGEPLNTDMGYRRTIEHQHVLSENHWTPTCLIGEPLNTDMSYQRTIEHRHVLLENHWTPICLIGEREPLNTDRRWIFLIGVPSEIDMPNRSIIEVKWKTNMPPLIPMGDQPSYNWK